MKFTDLLDDWIVYKLKLEDKGPDRLGSPELRDYFLGKLVETEAKIDEFIESVRGGS